MQTSPQDSKVITPLTPEYCIKQGWDYDEDKRWYVRRILNAPDGFSSSLKLVYCLGTGKYKPMLILDDGGEGIALPPHCLTVESVETLIETFTFKK